MKKQTAENKVQLFGLSTKAEEVRRVHKANAMRENKRVPVHLHPITPTEKVHPSVVSGGKYISPKLPNQAAPLNRTAITPKGDYKPGDGDRPIALRPGCDDHKKYKSLITPGTTIYARSHV